MIETGTTLFEVIDKVACHLATRYPRQKKHLGIRRDHRAPIITVDFSVDRYSDAFIEVLVHPWITFNEFGQ